MFLHHFRRFSNICSIMRPVLKVENSLYSHGYVSRNMKPRPYTKEAVKQKFDFFLVLDFEATCDKYVNPDPQEIIEIPVLKVNGSTMKIESTFHQYVQPQVHNNLSAFCTNLTGIIQEMVDGKPHLEQVLKDFDSWMSNEGLLLDDCTSIFITCGDWDLKHMLPTQCNQFRIEVAPYFKSWINIKKSFAEEMQIWPRNLPSMCKSLDITMSGRLHSGIDDCHNIAACLRVLAAKGHIFNTRTPYMKTKKPSESSSVSDC